MKVTYEVNEVINNTVKYAMTQKHAYITPEHLLYTISFSGTFQSAFSRCGGNIEELQNNLILFFKENIEMSRSGDSKVTISFENVFTEAGNKASSSGKQAIELSHIIKSILEQAESYAAYYISMQNVDSAELISEFISGLREDINKLEQQEDEEEQHQEIKHKDTYKKYTECLNDTVHKMNPLIGRERELERTIQILCRKDKNNPLHIGEPGVGKTAVTYGLARLLNNASKGKSGYMIPDLLRGAKIFSIDLGTMLAGTQFRGDFEKRFKEVMDSITIEEKPIIYIDEIHNIVGAGAVSGGSFDVANLLKPYLLEGRIRFIGATTYEEYKKHFSKNKSLIRRFQNVEIKEPDKDEASRILKGLKNHYETYHGVKYSQGVIEYAVEQSSKYITERFLPDKAIDLLDEAGAYRKLHPQEQKIQKVTKDLIDDVVSNICNVPKQVVERDEAEKLKYLKQNISSMVFGQDIAVEQVTNAIKFSRAGLLEDGKPLASLLFVGPTGVGKTELAKVLAKELSIAFIRFDMSEYSEKHSSAKLIGSPAGYVGYEEGGLLTEEIRKKPHAVLLLDEIEKAHQDIFNILLQIMDYATLTDNQGRKADFRNIIIIMTSNAGADKIGRESIGFSKQEGNSDVIMEEVKKIFSPEFRNRLSRIVVFNHMTFNMAVLVARKKLRELSFQLADKKVVLDVDEEAIQYIADAGLSKEYGAREINRLIDNRIKPLLVDELLFGKLKNGGNLKLMLSNNEFKINIQTKVRKV